MVFQLTTTTTVTKLGLYTIDGDFVEYVSRKVMLQQQYVGYQGELSDARGVLGTSTLHAYSSRLHDPYIYMQHTCVECEEGISTFG